MRISRFKVDGVIVFWTNVGLFSKVKNVKERNSLPIYQKHLSHLISLVKKIGFDLYSKQDSESVQVFKRKKKEKESNIYSYRVKMKIEKHVISEGDIIIYITIRT